MRLASILGAFAAALVLGACSLPVMDKESDGVARAFFDKIRTNEDPAHDAHLDPSLQTPTAAVGFAQIAASLPPGAPTKVNNTGFSYNSSSGTGSVARLSHQYVYGARTITIQTFMKKPPGGTSWFIVGIEFDPGGAQPAIQVGAEPATSSSDD
jgi:hypothetical protein